MSTKSRWRSKTAEASSERTKQSASITGSQSDTFNSALLEPRQGTHTEDPGSVSFFRQLESRPGRRWSDENDYLVHPTTYSGQMAHAFKRVHLRIPVLVAPYFFGVKMEQGLNLAVGLILMRYNDSVGGRLLAYQNLCLDMDDSQGQTSNVHCIPELKGKVPVPIRADFLTFSPPIGSTVYVQITELEGSRGIGDILRQASVRFDCNALFGTFMKYEGMQWRFGNALQHRLVIGCVFTAKVVSIGKEDDFGLHMSVEVVPNEEMIVLGESQEPVALKPTFEMRAPSPPRKKKKKSSSSSSTKKKVKFEKPKH